MIGNCPECQESIRVPDGLPSQHVRCPLCNAEYPLGNVFDALPPALEIVNGGGPELGIDVQTEDQELNVKNASSTSSRPRYQPQKKKSINPVAEILKVVAGGLLAVPVGILCVWWFAGVNPFGLSESVARFAPWIVPEKLRGAAGENPGNEPQDEATQSQSESPSSPLKKQTSEDRAAQIEANREMFLNEADSKQTPNSVGDQSAAGFGDGQFDPGLESNSKPKSDPKQKSKAKQNSQPLTKPGLQSPTKKAGSDDN